MLSDDHLHTTDLSPDASMSLSECCQAALAAGLDHITITNHLGPKGYFPFKGKLDGWEYIHSLDDLLASKELVEKTRGEYPELEIGFGIEADYEAGKEDELKELINGAGFDFILGSVHYLGEYSSFYLHRWPQSLEARDTAEEFLKDYFAKLERAALTGLFDCLAHVDVFKRGAPEQLLQANYLDYARSLAKVMKKKNMAFEFNTASLRRKKTLKYHPSKDIREVFFEEGIRIVTIGSDAHSAGSVGGKCIEARDLAKSEGFKTAFFKNRKPVYY